MNKSTLLCGSAALLLLCACSEPNAAAAAAAVVIDEAPSLPSAEVAVDRALIVALDAQVPSAAAVCNLESVDGALFSSNIAQVKVGQRLRGWLGHTTMESPVQPAIVFRDAAGALVDATHIALTVQRDDVVDANGGIEHFRHSGFEVPLPDLLPGRYTLALRYSISGQDFICDNGRAIHIG